MVMVLRTSTSASRAEDTRKWERAGDGDLSALHRTSWWRAASPPPVPPYLLKRLGPEGTDIATKTRSRLRRASPLRRATLQDVISCRIRRASVIANSGGGGHGLGSGTLTTLRPSENDMAPLNTSEVYSPNDSPAVDCIEQQPRVAARSFSTAANRDEKRGWE